MQADFLSEHVEHAGPEIIRNLSKALTETNLKVEIMNNRSLTLVLQHENPGTCLNSARIFLESLASSAKFSD